MNATGAAIEQVTGVEQGAATEQLWREMHGHLLSYVRGRVATVDDAEDILQDVFLRIHANLDRLKDSQRVAAWIYQIARNAITDYHRSRARRAGAAGLAGEGDEAAVAAYGDDAASDACRRAIDELGHCLRPFLARLPEHYRQAVTLTELKGMRQTEAARELGLSVSGMKARVQRGRGKLKEAILDCCAVEFDRRGGLVDYQRREGGDCEDCACE